MFDEIPVLICHAMCLIYAMFCHAIPVLVCMPAMLYVLHCKIRCLCLANSLIEMHNFLKVVAQMCLFRSKEMC